ncbi:hypothetical protein LCGC14_0428540 [marine sediment metagenome]|uniref:Holliday junction resolvase RuvC n=1 Tax=marine sediment metagenome TaxID=412755 RepID=A0A0F9SUY4_9ZZZZ
MAILALDLGTKTGWAIKSTGKAVSGVQDFKPRRFDGGGMRFLRFQRWLDEISQDPEPSARITEVYFEEVRAHRGTDAAHVYGGLMAMLTAWCEMHSVPYEGIPVGTIKRHATGRGNCDKQAMIDALKAKGREVQDDNEADALWLLSYVVNVLKAGT